MTTLRGSAALLLSPRMALPHHVAYVLLLMLTPPLAVGKFSIGMACTHAIPIEHLSPERGGVPGTIRKWQRYLDTLACNATLCIATSIW